MEDFFDFKILEDYVKKICSTRKFKEYVRAKHPLIQEFLEEIEAGEKIPALLEFQLRKEIIDNIATFDINDEFKDNNRCVAINFCGRKYVLSVNNCGELFLIPKSVYDKL